MKRKIKIIEEFERQIKKQGYDFVLSDDPNYYGHICADKKILSTLFINSELSVSGYDDWTKTLNLVKEYINALEKSDDLKAKGLRDGYKTLMEYNGYVLAMCEIKSVKGYEFVTWQYSYDRRSVNLGHYFSDYESAKEDMAIRCGLVDEYKMFSETEMEIIYTNLINSIKLDPNIDYNTEKEIGNILNKIEILIPGILTTAFEEIEDIKDEEELEM